MISFSLPEETVSVPLTQRPRLRLANEEPLRRFDHPGRNSYHRGMKTVVSEKGQITIPKPLRVRMGLRKGQVLEVREGRGRLVMTKSRTSDDPFDKYFGIFDLGESTDEVMAELRGREYPSGHRRRQ